MDYLFICKAKPEASTALKPLQTEPLLKENKLGMFQQLPTEINSAGPKQRANIEQSPKSVKSKVTNERPSRYPLHIPRVARATPRPGGLFTFPGKSIIPLTFPANTNKETPLCCRVFGRAEPRLAQLGGGWITLGFTLGTGQGRTAPGNPGAPGMQPQGRHPLPAPVTPATTQPLLVPRAVNSL